MNSSVLKSRFQDVYKTFFISNDTVISLPFLLNWTGDILPQFTGIHVKQKLPLRLYAGVKLNNSGKITFSTIEFFDMAEDNFIKKGIIEYSPFFSDYEHYFEKMYENKLSSGIGIEISLLSEVSQGIGLGFSSICSLLFLLLTEKTFNDKFLEFSHTGLLSQKISEDGFVRDLLFKSLKLKSTLDSPICVATQITALFDSVYPIVSFVDDSSTPESSDNLDIYGFRLNELDPNLPKAPFIPLDYGIAYCGRPVMLDNMMHTHRNASIWMSKVRDGLCEIFGESNIKDSSGKKFCKGLLDKHHDTLSDTYRNIMGSISIEVFYAMLKLFASGYSESSMRDFIDSLDRARWGYYITQRSSNAFKDFISNLILNFGPSNKMIGITPNDTTLMGGTITFILPLETYRKQFFNAFDTTRQGSIGAELVYANWTDGTEKSGLKIEQDVKSGKYGEHFSSGTLVLSHPSNGASYLGSYDELVSDRKRRMILDTLSKKILIDGEKITSDEHPSQHTAVQILEMLLSNPGSELFNKDLPKSSYSTNRNDMAGKIILPLNKLMLEKGISLSVICKGTISDFSLKLSDSTFSDPLYILRKI